MSIIGRKKEQDILMQCLDSKSAEFVVIYGRRRVGKTFLIKEYFNDRFSFYATGIPSENTKNQLKVFNECLLEYGDASGKAPGDWLEAFRRLKAILQSDSVKTDPVSGKRIVFLDEVPWMDTARSDFKAALDFFWNSWASSQKDLVLIVCGSATSWIINNIIGDTGGFYNRITRQIHLAPFDLGECKAFFADKGIQINDRQIIESYMVFGGIPYYLNLFDRRMSLASNIDSLIFDPQGQLHYEYDNLFGSLFKKPTNHIRIIETLAARKAGMLRTDLVNVSGVSDGEGLTKTLKELEQCGFIRRYKNFTKKNTGYFYQVTDPFVLFALNFMVNEKVLSWQKFIKSPGYYAWRGNAFEIVCLDHVKQIKKALGISGVESSEYSWRSKEKKNGVQIDLLIDRRDDMISLCEMKCTDDPFVIDKGFAAEIERKANAFRCETGTKKTVQTVLVSTSGIQKNEYSDVVQNVINGEDLFK